MPRWRSVRFETWAIANRFLLISPPVAGMIPERLPPDRTKVYGILQYFSEM